ncbi:MAG: amino acid adenylation domain-containing protein [Polyangia bacterium]
MTVLFTATATAGATTEVPGVCFHALFEAAAARVPQRTALVYETRALRYDELNERANRLAYRLRELGVGPDVLVALCVPRSAEMIIGLLGIMKAGGGYVPLLPESPAARLAHQLDETRAPVIVTTRSVAPSLPSFAGTVIALDDDEALASYPATNPPHVARPEHTAYVIYTSGSTGTPKGVAVRHENLVNYSLCLAARLELSDDDGLSFATVSTLAADLGNTCVFPSLMSGGTLHVISHDAAMDAEQFASYARENPIDVLKITPSHLGALLTCSSPKDALPRRWLVTGGEASSWALVDKVRSLSKLHWINHYGPTETTIGSFTLDLDLEETEVKKHANAAPIGRPLFNTRFYILDRDLTQVADGEVGELYIAGLGVSSGYLRQPEKTAERFLPEPGPIAGARMYWTGDRVKCLPNGAIEFLGRADHQVKIRGFRVELGEIDALIKQQPGVRDSLVVARTLRDDLQIVGYYVSQTLQPQELRRAIAAKLPEQMVPAHLVRLDALPLTKNGKVDRNALPEPQASAARREEDQPGGIASAPPTDELEAQLAGIWSEILHVKGIGSNDNFFEIGGHSLAAMHMLEGVRQQLGKAVPNHVLFHSPTVAAMAAYLRGSHDDKALRSLVPVQPLGSRPALFLVHGGGGEVFFYRDLARRLGDDQPIYGLQARREDDGTVKTRTVEEMAKYYLAEIRVQQPEGPYFLGGMSFGGKVAFEMAQMLRAAGQEVALVMLFDTWGPGYPRTRDDIGALQKNAYWVYQRLGHHIGSVTLLDADKRVPYLREKLHRAWLETKWAFEDLGKELQKKAIMLMGKEPPPNAGKTISFIAAATAIYEPRFYDGHVVLFRSRDQPLDVYPDQSLGWAPFVRDLEVCELPGIHATMTAEPRVRYLVEALQPMLERTQRS